MNRQAEVLVEHAAGYPSRFPTGYGSGSCLPDRKTSCLQFRDTVIMEAYLVRSFMTVLQCGVMCLLLVAGFSPAGGGLGGGLFDQHIVLSASSHLKRTSKTPA
jgi:hypothetical protein